MVNIWENAQFYWDIFFIKEKGGRIVSFFGEAWWR
jgi:hypothetical protein